MIAHYDSPAFTLAGTNHRMPALFARVQGKAREAKATATRPATKSCFSKLFARGDDVPLSSPGVLAAIPWTNENAMH